MRLSSIIIVVVVALVNAVLMAALHRPFGGAVEWDGVLRGLSFSPYSRDKSPLENRHPTVAEIENDVAVLAGAVRSLRTYSVAYGFDAIPAIAKRYDMKVTLGGWIGDDPKANEAEMRLLVLTAWRNPNVEKLVVGNEAILRDDVTVEELVEHIRAVKRRVRIPVSTAEPPHIWLKYPELARESDFIALQLLPYWEGVPIENAVDHVLERYYEIKNTYPDKPIVISEVGWPSFGKAVEAAQSGVVNQGRFLRRFLNTAQRAGIDYFVMEAFDQPWKVGIEGTAGAYWGIFDADRKPKFSLEGDLIERPQWITLAVLSGLFGGLLLLVVVLPGARHMPLGARVFLAFMFQGVITGFVLGADRILYQYLQPFELAGLCALLFAQVLLSLTLASEAFQFAELSWRGALVRQFAHHGRAAESPRKVSLHLPICNEPPDLVIETLESLAALDYPAFEVLVIDNNTKDPAVWRPVQLACARLGPKFRFFHVDEMKGFKAGALNLALRETAPDAEIIGVVDADYLVSPDWLSSLVGYFEEERVGFVQAPQDHRDWSRHPFHEMINWEYAGFFHIGMVHRNERNAIIQHGTMTLIRRSALERLGGWAEWCICEDAELGLRLLDAGYSSVYVNHPFGRGVVPDSFAGYTRQRFRWVFGAGQILRRHKKKLLFGINTRLTAAQRYHFVAGWMPWLTDLLHVVFTAAGLIWSVGLIVFPKRFDYPLSLFVIPALTLFGLKVFASLWLYTRRVPCTLRQRIGAAIAALALSYTVARGVLAGLFFKSLPFHRTPKRANAPALIEGVRMASSETMMTLMIAAAAAGLIYSGAFSTADGVLWVLMLGALSLPYVAAVILAVTAALPARPAMVDERPTAMAAE